MSHLRSVPSPSDGDARPNEDAADDTIGGCCPLSVEEEFSYRNPLVLGDSLVCVGRSAIQAADEGNLRESETMSRWLDERITEAARTTNTRHATSSTPSAEGSCGPSNLHTTGTPTR